MFLSVSVSFDLFLFSLFCLKQLLHVFVLGLYQEIICMYSILAVEYILWCLDQSHNTSWGMLFLFPEYGSLRLPLFNHECFFSFLSFLFRIQIFSYVIHAQTFKIQFDFRSKMHKCSEIKCTQFKYLGNFYIIPTF